MLFVFLVWFVQVMESDSVTIAGVANGGCGERWGGVWRMGEECTERCEEEACVGMKMCRK